MSKHSPVLFVFCLLGIVPQTHGADARILRAASDYVAPDDASPIIVAGKVAHIRRIASASTTVEANGDVSFLDLSNGNTALMKDGAKAAHVRLNGQVRFNANGSDISHLTLNDQASATLVGTQVSILNLYGSSKADLDTVIIQGGSISGVGRQGGIQVLLGINAQLTLHADDVRFSGETVYGVWKSGTHFFFTVALNSGSPEAPRYHSVDSMPTQIRVVPAAAGPSFACGARNT
jgi:hypothetical protein